jgi:hypothetical protein
MYNFPLGFQLSAKPLSDKMEDWMIPYRNAEEARKAQEEALNLKKGNNKSTTTKEGVGVSAKAQSSQSSYKDPNLTTQAKKPQAASPAKTKDAATNFLDSYEQILRPIPKGTAPAIDVLANMAYPEDIDLSNNDPYKPNRDIAKEFIDKFKSQSLNTNRIDLGPAMALADAWMKGKSNLAGSYRPPESADSIVAKMMRIQEESQKNSDDSEIRNRDSQTRAVEKLFVEPRESIARMLGNMSSLDTKTQASLSSIAARLLNETSNNEAKFQTLLDMNANTNRVRSARDEADAKYRNDKLGLARERWYSGQSGQKKSEWIKQEREESKLLAGKLLDKDITNEKNWKSAERDWVQFTRNMADKLVREHDLVDEAGGDYHAANMRAYQMLRDNYDPDTQSFPYLPIVDGTWQKFRKLNKK